MSDQGYGRVGVACLAAADIIWRFPVRLVSSLPEWIAPLLSVGATFSENALLAQSTTWLLFGVSFFIFTDTIYPKSANLPVKDARFQLLVATTGVALGLGFGFADGLWGLLPVIFPLAVISGLAFFVYFQQVLGWSLSNPESQFLGPLTVLDTSITDEFAEYLQTDTLVSSVNIAFVGIAAVGLVVVPCILLGLVSRILIRAYPLADLVILAILLSKSSDMTTISRVQAVVPNSQTFDIEARLHRGIETATQNIKGLFLTIYAFLGAFLGGGILGIAVVAINQLLVESGLVQTVRQSIVDPFQGWIVCGLLVLILLAGVHGLWVWLREFRRLTAYVSFWDDENSVATEIQPSRPVGMTIPTTLLVGIIGFFAATESEMVFAIAWPIGVAVTLGCMWGTRQQRTSSIANEDHAIVAAFLIHSLALPALVMGPELVQLISTGTFPWEQVVDSPAPVIAIMVVGMPYFPDVEQYAEQFDDARRTLEGIYLASIGILAQIVTLPAGPRIRYFGTLVLVVTVFFAVLGTGLEELDDETE